MSPDDVRKRTEELKRQGAGPRDAFRQAHREYTDAQTAREREHLDGRKRQ